MEVEENKEDNNNPYEYEINENTYNVILNREDY